MKYPDHLTKKRTDATLEYVNRLRCELFLQAWTITIDPTPADSDCYASVAPQPTRHHARLRLCAEWATLTAEQKRHTLLHELLHVCHANVDHMFEATEDLLGLLAYQALEVGYTLAMEAFIDGLSDVMAPLFPLPEGAAA